MYYLLKNGAGCMIDRRGRLVRVAPHKPLLGREQLQRDAGEVLTGCGVADGQRLRRPTRGRQLFDRMPPSRPPGRGSTSEGQHDGREAGDRGGSPHRRSTTARRLPEGPPWRRQWRRRRKTGQMRGDGGWRRRRRQRR